MRRFGDNKGGAYHCSQDYCYVVVVIVGENE